MRRSSASLRQRSQRADEAAGARRPGCLPRALRAVRLARLQRRAANEIWVSDHMIHDVEVQNDCFHDAPMGTPIRLRFTALHRFPLALFVVGCELGLGRLVALHHHRAAPCGHAARPGRSALCDNGKDYLKVAKGALPAICARAKWQPAEWYERELPQIEELGVLARLGMAVQHCIVRHPQSKHVERFFRTVHERFDKKFPTYTGGSPATRPDFHH